MESSNNKTFKLDINKDSGIEPVEVTIHDTTDGLPYYVCKIAGAEVQLRKDENWEVIWGELDEEIVKELGEAIDKHIINKAE